MTSNGRLIPARDVELTGRAFDVRCAGREVRMVGGRESTLCLTANSGSVAQIAMTKSFPQHNSILASPGTGCSGQDLQ